ncbi:hypothetical protein ACFFP0_15145 [Rhizobium puerariae]|uniref:Uncharacterized protein n=1 Tax=Rhizobium puerariae TaxID=1585791 RepID=A0ABV6AK23_9HYPH
MNASGEFLITASPRTSFGLPICDLGWNAALGLAEGLISLHGNRTTLAFLDARTTFRQAVDPAYRAQLSGRLLLPGGSRAFGLLMNGMQPKTGPARFSARGFVPALLTFLEKPCRIGIAGEDCLRVGSLRDHFARHSPWHDVVAIAPGQEAPEVFDLVIVDAPTLAEERRIERRLASIRTALVVMARADLSDFVEKRPHAVSKTGAQAAGLSFA